MDSEVRYGIVGTGMMGIEHINNLRIVPGAEVVAIADTDDTWREYGRQAAGDVPSFATAGELLDSVEVDALVVATPNHTHATVLADVWDRRVDILVEKPLCTTVEDCVAVHDAARDHPGIVWVGMEYRYMAPVARLVEHVRSGDVGDLVMLAIREHRFPFLPKVGNWNRFRRNTGGTLVEKCCHFFDLMNLVCDSEPVRVYASGGQDVNHLDETYDGEVPDILDNAFAVVDYAGGRRALLDLCMFAEGSLNHAEIAATGSTGKVEAFVPESKLVVSPRSGERSVEQIGVDQKVLEAGFHHGATYYEHVAFLDAIRTGTDPEVSVRDGLLAVAMGVAAERSVVEHRPVELAELGF